MHYFINLKATAAIPLNNSRASILLFFYPLRPLLRLPTSYWR
jgi:hypothetical protein